MEDDLKILKVEYLGNYRADHPQILVLNWGEQSHIENCVRWRWPQMEDYLKLLKVEYLMTYTSYQILSEKVD